MTPAQIWMIGHSTRKIDIFTSPLGQNGIKLLVDVRSLPGSRLRRLLEAEEFRKGIERLVDLATGRVRPTGGLASTARPTAIMCAEAVWWRRHRGLISDFLKAWGVEVTHILDVQKAEPHPFTSAAQIVNSELSYQSLL